MYLIIMDDGIIAKIKKYSNAEINACNDGYINLIDINDLKDPKSYHKGEWVSIEDA